MEVIGTAPINPFLFYTGKFSGYITWGIHLLLLANIQVLKPHSFWKNDLVSYPFLIFGYTITLISLLNLGRSTRYGLPIKSTVLKTKGLYKYSRNPMYLGLNLITLAAIIYTLNIWVILLGVYSIIVYHLIIKSEEQFLEIRFGSQYIDFKKKVGRYL